MTKRDIYADTEVRDFIDAQPRHMTYTEMAAACLARFGEERAWPRPKIVRYWQLRHPTIKGKPARLDHDADVRDFIEDRAGRITLDEMVAACRDRFGADRTPSRSGIHRFLHRRPTKRRRHPTTAR